MAKRRPCFEALEPRLCLTAAPPSFPGSPLSLLQSGYNGAWTSTPFGASPIYADLTGSGRDELIVAVAGGKLVAYTVGAAGTPTVFREYAATPQPGGVLGNIKSTPIVVTLPNGHKAIFAALGRDEAHPGALEDGRVFGWDAASGAVLPGWPQSSGVGLNGEGGSVTEAGVTGPLASGDLEGNGSADIVVTSFSAFVTAFRPDGRMLWRYKTDDSINGGAVVGDIDRSGKPSVVFGSDTSKSVFYGEGGFVNILSGTGSMKSRYAVGEGIWSSPVLADLDGNGSLEIVVGTGLRDDLHGDASPAVKAAGNVVIALDYQGHVLPGWPYRTTADNSQARETYASPAVADLLGNGQLEVIELDRAGFVHVIMPSGRDLPGWEGGRSIFPPDLPPQSDNFSSVIVADVTGDGSPDIIAAGHYALTAFDASGSMLWFTGMPKGPNGIPENLQNAPAVGQFDGTGGLELAVAAHVAAGGSNPPDLVSIYQLPASTLAPPWPMLRRSAAGVAVQQSGPFVANFVAHAFQAVLGRPADPAGFQYFAAALGANRLTRTQVVQILESGPEAQSRAVNALFRQFLGHAPDARSLGNYLNYLRTHTAQDAAVLLMTSPEFAAAHGRTTAGIIQGFYRDIFGRPAGAATVNGLVARVRAGTPLASVARQFLDTDEGIRHLIAPVYAAGLPGVAIPPDAFQAIAADVRRNRRPQDIVATILASGGNYAATDLLASWVRSVYRDVMFRDASPGEVGSWLAKLNGGGATQRQFVAAIVNSHEARVRYVVEQYRALLGRTPSAGEAAGLANYARRTDVIVALVGGEEYYNRHGRDAQSYVLAVYRDVAGLDLPASNQYVQGWIRQVQAGQPRSGLPAALVNPADLNNSATHDNAVAVADLFRYLPDESMGVLRTGNTLASAGQVVNPDPRLVDATVRLIQAGGEEGALATLLTMPQYFSKAAYYKGFYRSQNVRN